MTNEEPAENISAGTKPLGTAVETPDDGAPRAQHVVHRLGELYWRKSYGDRPAFACLVRTILSQNTSDKVSQPAFDALIDRYGSTDLAGELVDAQRESIAEAIQPAGLHNQKARVIQEVAVTICSEFGSGAAFDEYISAAPYGEARSYLLDLDGVGPKTADCVMLFAGGAGGVFPVDTHVYRIARRLGIAPPTADHETVREHLEADVDPEACGFGHTSMIQFGREYCTARTPACLEGADQCPLWDLCDQVGVDPEQGTVVDPSNAV